MEIPYDNTDLFLRTESIYKTKKKSSVRSEKFVEKIFGVHFSSFDSS